MNLRDKRILITGASSGIGEAAARVAAARGALPVLVARREEELKRVAEAVQGDFGIQATSIAGDLTNAEDRERIARETEQLGSLHVLVNNAGITAHGRFDRTDPSVIRRAMEINFFAVAEITRLLLPLLKKTSGQKSIVLVSTPSGLYGIPGRFAYSASKAAGHALMETLRMELKDYRIGTTIYCPGYVRTNLRTSGLDHDGGTLKEEQASDAREPEEAAEKLIRAVERGKRFETLGKNGRAVYWLRTLAPGLLERITRRKLRADFAED